MHINRDELIQEMILRKQIRSIIKESSKQWIKDNHPNEYGQFLEEQKLRKAIQSIAPRILNEEMSDSEAEDMAISFVRETLLAVIKIVKQDQSKFTSSEVQDGFIKFCLLALKNDFEENRGEEFEESSNVSEEDEDLAILKELEDNNDGIVDVKVGPKDDPMFISDEPDEPEEEDEEEDLSPRETKEQELYLTLSDEEKVGFRYARDNTWPKVTKQIKKIHKQVLPHKKAVDYYEEWLTKNFKLHGENTKEEMPLKGEEEQEEESLEL